MDELTWPDNFYDIGGKTFEWTWENKKDWCEFTMNEMNKTTGLFRKWKDYVQFKSKEDGSFTKRQKGQKRKD